MAKYTFITGSKGKIAEFSSIMQTDLTHIKLDLVEIQSIQVAEVVASKLVEAYRMIQAPVMVEDTGLYVNAWNGFPGALIKWPIESVGLEGICSMLDAFEDRSAYAQTIIGVYDGEKDAQFFEGKVEGRIADYPKGENGFGWDKLFIPAGEDQTFGEMDLEQKMQFSMRKQAILKMMEAINL